MKKTFYKNGLLTSKVSLRHYLKNIIVKSVLFWSLGFVCLYTLPSNKAFSQTYNSSYISYNYLEVIEYSIKFSYSSSGSYSHYSPYYSTGNTLATLQARYDYYHSVISIEYYKLKDLNLINKKNKETLLSFQNNRLSWIYKACSTWDLSNSTNSNYIINYCCEIYSYPSIKNEISLLSSINSEINRLKRDYPGEYHKTERYKELGIVMDKLTNCSISEIGQMSWDYGLK
jgi:hypothetical protein